MVRIFSTCLSVIKIASSKLVRVLKPWKILIAFIDHTVVD